jgi:hypothetical protein
MGSDKRWYFPEQSANNFQSKTTRRLNSMTTIYRVKCVYTHNKSMLHRLGENRFDILENTEN